MDHTSLLCIGAFNVGIKMAGAFANIFMAHIEEEIIRQSKTKPREWKHYIDDIFSQ